MIVSNYITLSFGELSKSDWRRLREKLTYMDNEGTVYEPWLYDPVRDQITLPRGAWAFLPDHVRYHDWRVCPAYPRLDFKHELDATLPDGRTFKRQREAVDDMLREEQGLIIRPPGTGKSQIALAFIAECETNVLVLVHTEDILQQWIDYTKKAIPEVEIGVIRQREETFGQVTIATIQTFARRLKGNPELKSRFGAVILDESHHAPAKTFEYVMNRMCARYRFGLTATEMRADGRHPYMAMVIGPVIHRMKFESPIPVNVEPLKTDFRFRYRGRYDWMPLLSRLSEDEIRNRLIAERADEEVRKGNSILVLSRRIEHLQRIGELMETFEDDGALLVGQYVTENGSRLAMSKKARKLVLEEFRSGQIKCVLATQLADEALDVPKLSRVMLIHPGKAEGRIIQQIGRALREHPGKDDALIIDVVDDHVGILEYQWRQRKQIYRKLGIPVLKYSDRRNGGGHQENQQTASSRS